MSRISSRNWDSPRGRLLSLTRQRRACCSSRSRWIAVAQMGHEWSLFLRGSLGRSALASAALSSIGIQQPEELTMRAIYTTAVIAVLAVRPLLAQAPAIVWGPAPAIFPAGAKMAVRQGDPGKAALFTVPVDMPNGYRSSPPFQ